MYNDQVRAVLGNILATGTANTRHTQLKVTISLPNLQLHIDIPIRNRRTLTSLVRWSRGWVFARRSLQLKAKSGLQTKGYRSQRLSYDRFLVLVDLVDLV